MRLFVFDPPAPVQVRTPLSSDARTLLSALKGATYSELASQKKAVKRIARLASELARTDRRWAEKLAPHVSGDPEVVAKLELLDESVRPMLEARSVTLTLSYALLIAGVTLALTGTGWLQSLSPVYAIVFIAPAAVLLGYGYSLQQYARLRDHVCALRAAIRAEQAN